MIVENFFNEIVDDDLKVVNVWRIYEHKLKQEISNLAFNFENVSDGEDEVNDKNSDTSKDKGQKAQIIDISPL